MSEAILKLTHRNSVEQNRQVMKDALLNNKEIVRFQESFKRQFGFDYMDEKEFPVLDRRFSWAKALEKMEMREAESAANNVQLLRAGIQAAVNASYQTVPTTWERWGHAIQSTRDTELYAPLHGITFPGEVGRQEKYPESSALGLDIKLRNRKYGSIFPVENELLADDQTGQFQKQAGLLGEYLKQVLEVLAYAKLSSSTSEMRYSNLVVPSSETKPTDEANYPYAQSSAPFVGGGYNRPATFELLTQSSIQKAFQALMVQKNKLGLRLLVAPDHIVCGPRYQFDVKTILNSSYYPTGATPGAVGGAFSINPLEGLADVTISRFIFQRDTGALDDGTATPWWLMDSKKPWFVVQIRQGALVEQEAPNAGESFERDLSRFKGNTRANADFIDPRFVWLGNDGSVTS